MKRRKISRFSRDELRPYGVVVRTDIDGRGEKGIPREIVVGISVSSDKVTQIAKCSIVARRILGGSKIIHAIADDAVQETDNEASINQSGRPILEYILYFSIGVMVIVGWEGGGSGEQSFLCVGAGWHTGERISDGKR